MPITISGSTGIAGVDGSASTPALQGTDTNTGIFFPAADTIAFGEGGSEAMRIDSSGNVGIGTSSVGARLDVVSSGLPFRIASSTASGYALSQFGQAATASQNWHIGSEGDGTFRFYNGNFGAGTERARIDSSGNFLFNSGYGSVATAYGCRAWVNFNGQSNTANLSGTYSQSGTTVTVSATAHGLIVGSIIYADITSGTAVDGTYTVATVDDANSFTYTAGTSLTTSGNITLRRNPIRASGNVTSVTDNGTGNYTVNFTNAMPDADYSVVATASAATNYPAWGIATAHNVAPTTTALRLYSGATGATAATGYNADSAYVSVAIFR